MIFINSICIILLLCFKNASASIYPIMNKILLANEVEYPIKAMPMYNYKDSPFWIGGSSEPFIEVVGNVSAGYGEQINAKPLLKITAIWTDELLSPRKSGDIASQSNYIKDCKNMQGNNSSDLNSLIGDHRFESKIIQGSKDGNKFSTKLNINQTGWYIVYVVNCLENRITLDATYTYHNPFGYLSGWAFGILPMNCFLFIAYGFLGMFYIYKTIKNKEFILNVQYAIIMVIIMGFIERLTWFLTYLKMNTTGGRACCPVRMDLTASLALAVFKRSSSALLLLAVCLGYGVVKPKLESKTTLKVVILGLIYTFASLDLELKKIEDVSKNGRQTDPQYASSLVVSICDVLILFWIYYAIQEILKSLRDNKQVAKLEMYQRLARALSIWVGVWFLFTFMEMLVFGGNINFSWEYWWILVSFWDIFFFGILCQICWIWIPSERTAQYAYSYQLPTTEELDEFDSAGLELQKPDTIDQNEFTIEDDDDESEEDDDVVSMDGIEAQVPNKQDKVAVD